VIFGFALIIAPIAGTITAGLLFGMLLLVMGICEVAFSVLARRWSGFVFLLIGGMLSLFAALVLLIRPMGGLVALTFLLGVYLVAKGIVNLWRAFTLKPNWHWEWLLFDALIGILLGILILAAWPSDSIWIIGLMFGMYMLFGGVSLILLSLEARKP
jgi:uncharacterized membrane protein HdeD (DUF308 family)